jgi:hypothetical protein
MQVSVIDPGDESTDQFVAKVLSDHQKNQKKICSSISGSASTSAESSSSSNFASNSASLLKLSQCLLSWPEQPRAAAIQSMIASQ